MKIYISDNEQCQGSTHFLMGYIVSSMHMTWILFSHVTECFIFLFRYAMILYVYLHLVRFTRTVEIMEVVIRRF